MKRIIISSIAILGIISGGLFVMDNKIIETPQSNIVQDIVVSELPVVETPETIADPTVAIETPVIAETPVIETEQKTDNFDELCFQYFIIERGDIFLCGQAQRLQKLNPEKFTPENVIPSFEYIERFFSKYDSQLEKSTSWREFTWY